MLEKLFRDSLANQLKNNRTAFAYHDFHDKHLFLTILVDFLDTIFNYYDKRKAVDIS